MGADGGGEFPMGAASVGEMPRGEAGWIVAGESPEERGSIGRNAGSLRNRERGLRREGRQMRRLRGRMQHREAETGRGIGMMHN